VPSSSRRVFPVAKADLAQISLDLYEETVSVENGNSYKLLGTYDVPLSDGLESLDASIVETDCDEKYSMDDGSKVSRRRIIVHFEVDQSGNFSFRACWVGPRDTWTRTRTVKTDSSILLGSSLVILALSYFFIKFLFIDPVD
jgi:hypothetical protein